MLVVSLNTLPYHMLSQFHADETVNIHLNIFLIFNKNFLSSIEIEMVQNVV
jgi:hypothetical protein